MKKVTAAIVLIVVCFMLVACDSNKIEDLSGTWRQVGTESEDAYQEAIISGDSIEIYWMSDGGDTKSLYWAGTYLPPEELTDPYSWDSVNNTEKTASALLASNDETKTFTFEDGVLSYSVSAFGTTTKMKLEKKSDSVSSAPENQDASFTQKQEQDVTEQEEASSAVAAVEMQTVTLDGISFQYDPQYSYDAESKTLSFENGKAFVNILQVESIADILESGGSEDDEFLLEVQHQSFLSGFSLTEEVEPEKTEISGKYAVRSAVTMTLENDLLVSYDLVTFNAGGYCYGFAYATTGDRSEYAGAFQQVLDSIEITQ